VLFSIALILLFGFLIGLVLEKIKMPKLVGMLKQKGFSTYSHENSIIVAPPLIIKENEIKEAMSIMDEVLTYADTLVK
jgi:taurine--2-oxoglutarate transaminase